MKSALEIYLSARDRVRDIIIEKDKEEIIHYVKPTEGSNKNSILAKPVAALTSGHKPRNFVSGDTDFEEFQSLLIQIVLQSALNEHIFVDLGCGKGDCCAAALLLSSTAKNLQLEHGQSFKFNVKQIIGIDIMHYKIEECQLLCDEIIKSLSNEQPPAINIIEGDFFTYYESLWKHATILYACSTCFTDCMMDKLFLCLQALKSQSIVVLLDKQLPQSFIDDNIYRFLQSVVLKTSWGEGTANVYQKGASL